MVKKKLTALTEVTSTSDNDLIHVVINPSSTPLSRKIKIGNFKLPNFPNTKFVLPSGDTSGAADVTNIQDAINTLQTATPSSSRATVLLSGVYYINTALTLGAIGNLSRVSLHGIDKAYIIRAGSDGTPGYRDYMIRLIGATGGNPEPLRNLRLYCSYKSRGILCTYATHSDISNIQVFAATEVAYDFIDCWNSMIRNIGTGECRGFGMRTRNGNGCHYDGLQFNSVWGLYTTKATPTNAVLWDEAMTGALSGTPGNVAAKAYFDGLYGVDTIMESWPAADDTMCIDSSGAYYRTTSANYAVLSLDGNGNAFTNLCIESTKHIDYPLIYAAVPFVYNRFNTMRLEANQNRLAKIKFNGSVFNLIDFVSSSDGRPNGGTDYDVASPVTGCQCFLRLTGTTKGNQVNRLVGTPGATEHIIILDGGTHTGTKCTDCATTCSYVLSANWIGTNGSPVVNPNWPDRS